MPSAQQPGLRLDGWTLFVRLLRLLQLLQLQLILNDDVLVVGIATNALTRLHYIHTHTERRSSRFLIGEA